MKIEAILVANRAHIDGALLFVEGGGWEFASWEFFPGTISAFIAGVLALDESEIGGTPSATLELSDQEGHVEGFRASIIASGVRPKMPGSPARIPFAIPFMTVVRSPTVMNVVMTPEGGDAVTIHFGLVSAIPDELPPTP
jgi:hypothetical protein